MIFTWHSSRVWNKKLEDEAGCGGGWAGTVDLVSSCDKEVNLVGS